MRCDAFHDNLDDFRRGDLPPAEEAAMRAHIAECPSCEAELATAEALGRLLRKAEISHPDDSYFDELQTRVAREREHRISNESGRNIRVSATRRYSRRWLEMAAAFTVGVGLTMLAGAGLRFLGGSYDMRAVRAIDHAARSRILRDVKSERRTLATAINAYSADSNFATEGVPAGMVVGRPEGFSAEPLKEMASTKAAVAGGSVAAGTGIVPADEIRSRGARAAASAAPENLRSSVSASGTREEAEGRKQVAGLGATVRGVENLAMQAPKLQLGGTSNLAQNQLALNRDQAGVLPMAPATGAQPGESTAKLKAARPAVIPSVPSLGTVREKDATVLAPGSAVAQKPTNGVVEKSDIARQEGPAKLASDMAMPAVSGTSLGLPVGAPASPVMPTASAEQPSPTQVAKVAALEAKGSISASRRILPESSSARVDRKGSPRQATDLAVDRLLSAEDLALSGKHAEALAAFRDIAAERPAGRINLRAQFRVGEILADRLGDRTAAREAFEACLRDPFAQFLSTELRTEIEARISRLR